ncbi:PREDICTED: telomerase protein component 1-like [Branchiostoma belcheri]|uniref:Telomerase protein component 1-like n=1 Tax=Branchiostoma belcheri TaxID=7741 RepID=A0A6P4XNQ2_BRABE|nr:PREDICTED: telomerase protein component 1-like [Branchiostoma belcheri]
MGCGASTNYQYEVNLTWEQVSRTVDTPRPKKDKLVLRHSNWKTVRIFVSSTFKDFHSERDVLVKEVFADLRHWCEKRRLHLVECDLRWGIPKDTTTEFTLRTCLEEIDRCYEDNIMPFFLNMTSERCGWIPGVQEVPPQFAAEYRWIHGLSVTEMEIMHGAYRKGNPNSLFMIRDGSFLESVPERHHQDFIDITPEAPFKLKMLKKMLQDRFEANQVCLYQCEVAGVNSEGRVQLKGLDNFSQKVFEFFTQRIGEQYPLEEIQTDPYKQQEEAHEAYMKNKGDLVLGRDFILQEIQQYITELGVDYPMLLVGEAGSGKSAILARVADVATTKALSREIPGGGDTGWHVFYHFVGAIPGSTDLENILKRLLRELDIVNDTTMPKDMESTVQLTCGVLSSRTTRPTIIIIDAVNQMDEDPHSQSVSWLPRKLAPQVRVVLSMIDGTPQHHALTERQRKPHEVRVTALSKEDREEIVRAMLDKYNKRLDQHQMNSLLSKDSSDNPLWLSVACEELRVYGVFEKVSDKINSLADGLLNLLAQVLERFEREYGGTLLVATLCLLETSAKGMLEVELLRLLGNEKDLLPPDNGSQIDWEARSDPPVGQVAPVRWAGVYRALKPFLRPFGDSGEGRLDFYHRSLSKAVRRKYFGSDEEDDSADSSWRYRWWHHKLANFFDSCENIDRRVEEYPHHLVQLGAQKRLAECLTEWDMFDNLYHPEWSAQLLLYWRKAGGYDTMDRQYREALNRIKQDPEVSVQDVVLRHEKVARVLLQAGKLEEAKGVIQYALEREEAELGARPDRMTELYYVAGLIYDEIVKSVEFVSTETMDDLQPCMDYLRKSIALREQLEGDHHKYQRAFALVKLAFALNNWSDCGGDASFSRSSAADEGFQVVGEAIRILRELGDNGHLAEAVMTKGILMPRYNTQGQMDLYEEALELSKQAYGENNTLSSRIYGNMGIAYETIGQVRKSYRYFQLAAQCTEEVFGPDHPKTLQNKAVLEEDTYLAVARQIQLEAENRGVQDDDDNDGFFDDSDSDEGIDEEDNTEDNNVQEERQEPL